MLKSDKKPGGLSISVFDEIRVKVVAERSQFFKDLLAPAPDVPGLRESGPAHRSPVECEASQRFDSGRR